MFRIPFLLVLLLLSINLLAQKMSYEQIAIDYFFDSIFTKYQSRIIEFSDSSEAYITSFKTYSDCFNKNEGVRQALNEPAVRAGELDKIFINLDDHENIKSKNIRPLSNQLKLKVSLAQEHNSKFYVLIEVYKKMHFTDAFMLEINSEGNILRWCKTGIVH